MKTPTPALLRGSGGRERLPVPADFAERAEGARNLELCDRYGVSIQIIFRWRKESGVRGKAKGGTVAMPPAPGFAEVAATTRNDVLVARFGVSESTLIRWRKDLGIRSELTGNFGKRVPKAPPADFQTFAAGRTARELAAHYGVSTKMVRRWFGETGVAKWQRAPRQVKPAPTPRVAVPRRRNPPSQLRSYAGPKSAFTGALQRDVSTEGQAADVLRRFCAVYRCTERGAADPKGSLWRYGNAILTGAELIERAKRHGFDPQAWARIAA